MDWFRRNWPDLLIGIALVAVIAGIIATLITGGSFFPVGQGTRTATTPPAQSSTVTPPSTSTASNPSDNGGAGSIAGGAATTGTQPAGTTAANGAGSAAAGDGAANGASTSGISVLPPGDAGAANGAGAASSATPAAATTSGAASNAAATTTTPGAVAAPAATAATGPGSDAPFRISVGAFSNPDNAQTQAATFRQSGYPVFTAPQGDLTIVLIGPYATQAEADAAAARIRQGGFGVDPVIYRFRGENDSAPAAPAGTATVPSTPASTSTAATTSSAAPATTSGGRYLQAGAYGTSESAKPQRDRLESLGFRVTERTENGLVKLLIGPFDDQQLQQAKGQLDAAGIESFAR